MSELTRLSKYVVTILQYTHSPKTGCLSTSKAFIYSWSIQPVPLRPYTMSNKRMCKVLFYRLR